MFISSGVKIKRACHGLHRLYHVTEAGARGVNGANVLERVERVYQHNRGNVTIPNLLTMANIVLEIEAGNLMYFLVELVIVKISLKSHNAIETKNNIQHKLQIDRIR